MRRCPICEKPVQNLRENAAFPFCSERCRLIDLGRWIDEDYKIPDPDADEKKSPDDQA